MKIKSEKLKKTFKISQHHFEVVFFRFNNNIISHFSKIYQQNPSQKA